MRVGFQSFRRRSDISSATTCCSIQKLGWYLMALLSARSHAFGTSRIAAFFIHQPAATSYHSRIAFTTTIIPQPLQREKQQRGAVVVVVSAYQGYQEADDASIDSTASRLGSPQSYSSTTLLPFMSAAKSSPVLISNSESSNEEPLGEAGGNGGRGTEQEEEEEGTTPLVHDDETWQHYSEIMTGVMQRERVIGKQLTAVQVQAVQEYLLLNCALPDTPAPPGLLSTANSVSHGETNKHAYRDRIQEHRQLFLRQSNFTIAQHEYCGRCFAYLTDFCARRQLPGPCVPAWRKLREIGLVPRENSVSTFLYVLSIVQEEAAEPSATEDAIQSGDDDDDAIQTNIHEQQKEACLDVAVFHDLFYEPSEKTATLRIKALITKGETAAAEQILASFPDNIECTNTRDSEGDESSSSLLRKRLRTYAPILQYYCDTGDVVSALRLYREMQHSPGVHLLAETYALLISTLARNGWFQRCPSEQQSETVTSYDSDLLRPYGFSASSGPALFDQLASEMADDILELDESSANAIIDGFNAGFGATASSPDILDRVFVGRVSVDNTTAVCPESGAKLRLVTLSNDQRRNVRDTLLEMAATQHEEYGEKLLARRQGKPSNKLNITLQARNGTYALAELSKFSDWLRLRHGDAFTAIIDGPNVAYYGHGDVHWSQVELVVDKLEQMGEIPLVIMPQKYVAPKFWLSSVGFTQALSEHELEIMTKLLDTKKMYVVPTSCLDDYYWMLGSVTEQKANQNLQVAADDDSGRFPGLRPILVTNDQMRDHRLSLLEPRLFRRWTSSHIVNYDIKTYENDEWEERHVSLFPADLFSREIQSNIAERFGNSTAWHFPVSEWPEPDRMCVAFIQGL